MVIKKLLFGFILLFLAFSMLEQQFSLFDIAELKGEFTKAPNPALTLQSWLDGSFQTQKENYLNENFGFRNTLVRLNNQIAFSFYHRARSKGVIVGKENYLYGDTYVNAYYGNDFLGKSKIQETVRKLQFLRDTLKKKNIDLMVVIVPGKASFFPEFLPECKRMATWDLCVEGKRSLQSDYGAVATPVLTDTLLRSLLTRSTHCLFFSDPG